MKRHFRHRWLSICVLSLVCLFFSAVHVCPAAWKVHGDVWLKNELGEKITPNQNRLDPYSTRSTCGGCHGYSTITSGYHFQQGFDQISDRYNPGQPWVLSPGMYGKWQPTAAPSLLARKSNRNARHIDLSTYDWIGGWGKLNTKSKIKSPACGWCHPGGGPLEYGRGANGRRDLSVNHIRAEEKSMSPLDGDYSSRLTPDGRSHFKESGVLEADCLICHLTGYRMDDRNQQISARNYRWAATAGAGLGKISGSVFSYRNPTAGPDHPQFMDGEWNFSKRPVVSYYWNNRNLFTGDGMLKGSIISKSVGSRSCQHCHRESDAKNTGSLYEPSFDVHANAKFQCTDCHGLVGKNAIERLRHQIAKGWSPHNTVRDDLDGAEMKTCAGCHIEGRYTPSRKGMPAAVRSPSAAHAEKLPKVTFHTYIISCTGCHATVQPARGMYLLDMSTGLETGYTADAFETVSWLEDYTAISANPWKPWMTRAQSGKSRNEQYTPYAPKVLQWFGEKMTNGEIRPIRLVEVRQSLKKLKGITTLNVKRTDGSAVKQPSVVTEEDMRQVISVLTGRGFRNVVFVSDKIYELKKGKIVSYERPVMAHDKPYPVVHNIVSIAKKSTYGAKGSPDGCMDCHGDSASFFTKMKVIKMGRFLKDDYPVPKEPNAEPQMYEWGIRSVPAYE